MNNTIYRQAVIDAIYDEFSSIYCDNCANQESEDDSCEYCHRKYMYWSVLRETVERVINGLLTAQPEIIFCGDCKYKDDGIDEDGIPFLKCLNSRSYGDTRINDFCSWAERREDE